MAKKLHKMAKNSILPHFVLFFGPTFLLKALIKLIIIACHPSHWSASTDIPHGLCDGIYMGQNMKNGLFWPCFAIFLAIMSDSKIQLAKIFFVCDPSNQSASTDTLHGLCDGMNMGQNGTIRLFGHVLLIFLP